MGIMICMIIGEDDVRFGEVTSDGVIGARGGTYSVEAAMAQPFIVNHPAIGVGCGAVGCVSGIKVCE